MDNQNEASSETFSETFAAPESSTRETIFTIGRIINVVIAIVCVLAMISCIVCLGVMANKHKEIINNKDPGHKQAQNDKKVCILFTSAEETKDVKNVTKYPTKYNKSHACQFVIFGSGIVSGLLLIAAIYFVVRLFIMRR